MVQCSFFEYKMSASDSIITHVNKVMSMGNLLKDLGQPVPENMLMTKIVCNLPLSYNSILATWTNVPAPKQTIANMNIRLLQMENLMALQDGENKCDSTFFTRSNKTPSKKKKQSHEKDKDYIIKLNSCIRYYNSGEFDHWTVECPHPHQDKVKFFNHKKHQSKHQPKDTRGKQNEACVITTTGHTNSSSSDSFSNSDHDTYAFMTTSRQSHALRVNLDKQAWFDDFGATEHMMEHKECFSTFKSIPSGT